MLCPLSTWLVSGATWCPAHTQTTDSGRGTLDIQRGLAPGAQRMQDNQDGLLG